MLATQQGLFPGAWLCGRTFYRALISSSSSCLHVFFSADCLWPYLLRLRCFLLAMMQLDDEVPWRLSKGTSFMLRVPYRYRKHFSYLFPRLQHFAFNCLFATGKEVKGNIGAFLVTINNILVDNDIILRKSVLHLDFNDVGMDGVGGSCFSTSILT